MGVTNLSGNAISKVWREDHWIYKRQFKYLCDNEMYALEVMAPYRYTPTLVERVNDELIRMYYTERMDVPVERVAGFFNHCARVLAILEHVGLRHGDLTLPHVIPNENYEPVIIDWAESRTWKDPRPDKRREGDRYWLTKTMQEICRDG